MKIEMCWAWLVAFALLLVFQTFFTVKKTEWDVSYTYINESMDWIAHGQMALNYGGEKLPWMAVKKYIEEVLEEGDEDGGDVTVTILAVHRSAVNRYLLPPWVRWAS